MRRVIYSGTFDPFTNGHYDIAQRAAALFQELIILVLDNRDKDAVFSFAERVEMIEETIRQEKNIIVDSWSGLLVDYCRSENITTIVRGLRNEADFSYERDMALANKSLFPSLETIFITTKPEYAYISSSLVKTIAAYGGDIDQLVPAHVASALMIRQTETII